MEKQFKLLIILQLLFLVFVKQSFAQNKYEEMRNAFLLGLETKGLEICNDLISLNEFKEFRSETIFFIANYFLQKAFLENQNMTLINKAYTFYSLYEIDYPNGKEISTIKKRKQFLENSFFEGIQYGNLLDSLHNEKLIVENKLDFANLLLKFNKPNIFEFFNDSKFNDSQETVDKYFDDIIINYPEFEIYAYYYKILLKLSEFKEINFVSEGILPFKKNNYRPKKIDNWGLSEGDLSAKKEVYQLLDILSSKYPNHPITLNLHLIFSKVFMTRDEDKIDYETLKHLEFILKNDLDQTDIKYMLAKEFILNNKFEKEQSK